MYATDLPSDYWLTTRVYACLGKVVSSQTLHKYKPLWVTWLVIFEALLECYDVLILGT